MEGGKNRMARLTIPAGLLAFYFVAYGILLAANDGLPYVIDNNETYSAFVHARNFWRFGIDKSAGLADESCHPNESGHPFVHTHQGNFPRVFAILLYAVGVRTAAGQLLVTAATIGSLTILMYYFLFLRLTTPGFASLFLLLLLTNYLMFAQWFLNSYRIWHFFFIASSLHCVHGIGSQKPKRWFLLAILNFAALFYYELIFVAFVTILSAIYCAATYGRKWRTSVRFLACQAIGAGCALGLLFVQLVHYMGPANTWQDAVYTFTQRNFGSPASPEALRARAFYAEHNILFWPNIFDGRSLLSLRAFIKNHFTFDYMLFTPFLVLHFVVLAVGIILGQIGGLAAAGCRRWVSSSWPERPSSILTWASLLPLCSLLAKCVLCDNTFIGQSRQIPMIAFTGGHWFLNALSLTVGMIVSTCLIRLVTGSYRGARDVSWVNLAAMGGTVLFAIFWLRNHYELYNLAMLPVWESMRHKVPSFFMRLSVLATTILASCIATRPFALAVGRSRVFKHGGLLLGCAALAYLTVYRLSPGYIYTGYMVRWLSFYVVFSTLLAAAFFYAFFHMMHRLQSRSLSTSDRLLVAGLTIAPCLLLSFYWLRLQAFYLQLWPADNYQFLSKLERPPFAGQSFVTNAYPLPIACHTGGWAYMDPVIGAGIVQETDAGFLVEQDANTFLWFPDRNNPGYRRPKYLLLVSSFDLWRNVNKLRDYAVPNRFEDVRLFEVCKLARRSTDASDAGRDFVPLQHKLIDCDDDGRWAIVELDWDFPPYLRPLPSTTFEHPVQIEIARLADKIHVDVRYEFCHQEGKEEADTVMRLYAAYPHKRVLLQEKINDGEGFELDKDFAGNIMVSVIPKTATKCGREYSSDTYRIGEVASLRPPQLKPLSQSPGRFVAVNHLGAGRFRVRYAYYHSEAEPEHGSIIKVYEETDDGELRLLQQQTNADQIVLDQPESLERLRVSITPCTQLKKGREYFSESIVDVQNHLSAYSTIPYLKAEGDANPVKLNVSYFEDYAKVTVTYRFGDRTGRQEKGTQLRLYRQTEAGGVELLNIVSQSNTFLVPAKYFGTLRVSVTPGNGIAFGPEYFSDPVVLRLE
ncbi:MAG: hypothetical protein KatS3mg105_2887 [Gemmatales bacterium]|nr:MAG: hypothetical protein KatS3mg105_2887 [Gemmatales bacterium]